MSSRYIVAYLHSTTPQMTALQHSGSNVGPDTCTLGATHVHSCSNDSTAVQGSQARSSLHHLQVIQGSHTRES